MAALRGKVRGARGETTRLGTKASGLYTEAATWETFANVHLNADGSGEFRLSDRYGMTIKAIRWGTESLLHNERIDDE